jgi:phytoene desaturase
MPSKHYDALVIGAGIGGLCAAARLVDAGYSTLLVERLERVGGRASTEELDGFLINTGAAAVEFGGATQEAASLVGASLDLRRPKKPAVLRLGRVTINLSAGMSGRVNKAARRVMQREVRRLPRRARKLGVPEDAVTTEQWLGGYTKSKTAHAIVRNLCAAFLAANADEVPAKVFLSYFSSDSAFKDYGFHPEGTIGVPRAIAEGIRRRGGEVWLASEVRPLLVEDGLVKGALVQRAGETVEVACDFAVSDVGPKTTVDLVGPEKLPDDYVRQVALLRPCPLITVNFATRRRILNFDGGMFFGRTDRLAMIVDFTATCPERAPEGWHLYLGWALPKPALADFDSAAEIELTLQELRRHVPGFQAAKVLSTAVHRDEWPAQRSLAGFDAPHTTPLANLWNVGDGVKRYAEGGMEACAKIAKVVVHEIAAKHEPATPRAIV